MRIRKSFAQINTASVTGILLPALLALFSVAVTAQASFLDSQFQIVPSNSPNSTSLLSPSAVAVDLSGNVYLADSGNNRILELPVTATGSAQPVVLLTNLAHPGGIQVDVTGNLYISDSGNNRILKLPVASGSFGAAITVGSGLNTPGGVAVDLNGNVFVADTGNNRVVEFPIQGTSYGAATVLSTGYSSPAAVAVDGLFNLYIADTGNSRIMKQTYSNGYPNAPTSIIGGATALSSIAVDATYDIFYTSASTQQVVEVPWSAGAARFNTRVTMGSGFSTPAAVVPDSKGNVYVVDSTANQAWEIPLTAQPFAATPVGTPNGSVQVYNFTLAAGTTVGSYAVLTQGVPHLDFSDAGNSTCTAQTVAAATTCSVEIAFNPTGSGRRQGAVVLYDGNGNMLVTAYISGIGTGTQISYFPPQQIPIASNFSGPSGVAVDAVGNVYVADTGNNRVVEIPYNNGAYGSQIVLPVTQINTPMGLAIDGAGNLFVASNGNDKIMELPRTATGFGTQTKVNVAVYAPSAVSFDAAGTMYISDTYDNRIAKLTWKGTGYSAATVVGNYIKMPMGAAADNAGNVYFSMAYANDFVKVPLLNGKYQPQVYLAVTKLSMPTSVVTDANNNVYLLDSGNNRIVMYPATAAGTGTLTVVASGFNAPVGMAIDPSGNLYVADSGNNRIVRINLGQPGALNFNSTYVNTTLSGSQTTLVQNTGNTNTTVTAVSYPTDFPEYSAATNTCVAGTALAPGIGCPLTAAFSPQTAGNLNESISASITDSVIEWTASIPVTGASLSRTNQTITVAPIANPTYGTATVKLSATATSNLAVTFQLVSGPATVASNGTVTITGVGAVTVSAQQAGNSTYQVATANITFNVLPATLTVTPSAATATYGAIPSTFTYTITGFVLGQTASQAVTGTPQITVDAGAKAAAGTHSLLAALGTLQSANYQFAFTPGTITVKQATLQIAAAAAAMAYGASLPKFTWTANGFLNGDTTSVLSGAPVFATPASSRSAAGAYTITPTVGTLTAANYTFTFASATLTVTQAALTITANNQSMTYGSPLPTFTYFVQGLQGADTAASVLTGTPIFTTAATSKSKTGSYALTIAAGTLASTNYALTFANGTLTVTPASLTVAPAAITMTYGQTIPSLTTLQLTGLVNGDTQSTALTGSPAISTTATSGTAPGNATITIQEGTLASINYTLNLQPGTLTINPAALTVTPTTATRIYGAANPNIAYTITGFVHGDTAATALTGAPAFTTPAIATSPAGSYAVTANVGTLTSACYTFTFAAGTLTVTKALLSIIANSASITYGGALPNLTYGFNGFQNGETASVLTGTPALSTIATAAPAAGSYPITLNISSVSAANYTLTAVNGTLTVAPALATVTANSLATTAGNAIPTLTYTITGLIASDSSSSAVTGTPTLSTTATKTSAAGAYPITIANGSMAAKNYTLTLANGTLTLTQPAATVANPNPVTPRLPSKKLP